MACSPTAKKDGGESINEGISLVYQQAAAASVTNEPIFPWKSGHLWPR